MCCTPPLLQNDVEKTAPHCTKEKNAKRFLQYPKVMIFRLQCWTQPLTQAADG